MSQYAEPFSASELVGAATGVAGWDRGGKLTNAVRTKPYSVVLLDEFEKAHRSVWDLFLPVFENGRLDDALDRVIDFRNTVVIMTTNVGARRFQARAPIGFSAAGTGSLADVESDVLDDLKETFTPEFLNRIDETIVFNALTKADIRKIVRQQIEETVRIELELTPEALEYLVDQSYDPAMGARPVRRAIQRLIANPLSLMVARGELDDGAPVQASLVNGELTFHRVRR
jgi:ATP-dependent Clp protease ATP-binding subunit ClpC